METFKIPPICAYQIPCQTSNGLGMELLLNLIGIGQIQLGQGDMASHLLWQFSRQHV